MSWHRGLRLRTTAGPAQWSKAPTSKAQARKNRQGTAAGYQKPRRHLLLDPFFQMNIFVKIEKCQNLKIYLF